MLGNFIPKLRGENIFKVIFGIKGLDGMIMVLE
jgi:hypothetical protein